MEIHSNNLIKQKIDSVNSLPEDYSPNLNNKWEILEAGLVNKKKPVFLFFNKISAIAAMLLLIGGVSVFFIKSIKRNDAIKPTTIVVKPFEKENNTAQTTRPIVFKKSDKKQSTKAIIFSEIMEEKPATVQRELITEDSIKELPNYQTNLAIVTPKKTNRFTEIDFNEPIVQEKPTISNMAFNQRFSFKIGALPQNNGGSLSKNESSNLGLTKQFN